jgi:hypothetical protein
VNSSEYLALAKNKKPAMTNNIAHRPTHIGAFFIIENGAFIS